MTIWERFDQLVVDEMASRGLYPHGPATFSTGYGYGRLFTKGDISGGELITVPIVATVLELYQARHRDLIVERADLAGVAYLETLGR